MSVTISIRVDDDVKEAIEDLGYNPGEYVKKVVLKELRKERSLAALNWLKKNRLPPGKKSGVEMIREDRDSR